MRLIYKPYTLFWITGILILIDGFFIQDPEATADINVHDTYYLIAHGLIAEIFTLLFFILGLGYWLFEKFNRNLNSILTFIHVLGTVGVAWIYKIVLGSLSLFKIDNSESIYSFIMFSFSIAFLVQPIYVVNIFIGIIKQSKTKYSR